MFEVKFADIGEGIHEGVLHKWEVESGQSIQDGDTLFLVETDKVTAEIPSPVDGTIREMRANVGDTIHVGDTIVVIDDGIESEEPAVKQVESVEERGSTSVVGEIEVSDEVISASTERADMPDKPQRKVLATPVARKMAKDLGVDIDKVAGSGPAGRVMKQDIRDYHEQQASGQKQEGKASGPTGYRKPESSPVEIDESVVERIPMSMMRKTIAKNMVQSKFTIPHTAAMDDADVTELVSFRADQKERAREEGVKLTYMPFIVKAVSLALSDHPELNAMLDEGQEEILIHKKQHIGIAVDTDKGLMVPVLHNVKGMSVYDIAEEIERLSASADDHSLQMKELEGGTFTITNYGSIGASYGVPVIRYPEAAILGVGSIVKKPVVIDEQIVIRDVMPLSISFDHRIVDGANAGRFIQSLKKYLSDPMLLLLR